MSALFPRTPQVTDFQQPSKYQLFFPQGRDMTFFCQDVTIPGVTMGEAQHVTPNLDLWTMGTKLVYNPFVVTFIVNETLSSWLSIYNWMKGVTTDGTPELMKRKDAILTILSASNNPQVRIKFSESFPLSLSDINLSTSQSAETILTATANFRYNYFTVESL